MLYLCGGGLLGGVVISSAGRVLQQTLSEHRVDANEIVAHSTGGNQISDGHIEPCQLRQQRREDQPDHRVESELEHDEEFKGQPEDTRAPLSLLEYSCDDDTPFCAETRPTITRPFGSSSSEYP